MKGVIENEESADKDPDVRYNFMSMLQNIKVRKYVHSPTILTLSTESGL
jgi:hypothetical protein